MIEKFIKRTSVRDFTNDKMTKEEIGQIKEVINNAPTSTNAQQFSAIIIQDQEMKEYISKNNWNQKHILDSAAFIVFISDRTRTYTILEERNLKPTDGMKEHDFVRSLMDATIAATYAQDALIHMGYGVTMVGGVQKFGNELAQKLNMPETSFVVVGLSVGKAAKSNPVKPKIDKVFFEKYSIEQAKKSIYKYEEDTKEALLSRNQKTYFDSIADENDMNNLGKYFDATGKVLEKTKEKFK